MEIFWDGFWLQEKLGQGWGRGQICVGRDVCGVWTDPDRPPVMRIVVWMV